MPTIHITNRDGSRTTVQAASDLTLMEVMIEHELDVEGVCGGAASCGTCHVHIAPNWFDQVGSPESTEADLLDGLMNTDKTSRLGCQIKISDNHDGLVVTTAQSE